jgi:hypothetical protein
MRIYEPRKRSAEGRRSPADPCHTTVRNVPPITESSYAVTPRDASGSRRRCRLVLCPKGGLN